MISFFFSNFFHFFRKSHRNREIRSGKAEIPNTISHCAEESATAPKIEATGGQRITKHCIAAESATAPKSHRLEKIPR